MAGDDTENHDGDGSQTGGQRPRRHEDEAVITKCVVGKLDAMSMGK